MPKRGRPKIRQLSIDDILHTEHLACLRQAKMVREVLAQQIEELKGKIEQNPSMTTEDRMEIISGIGEVYAKLIRVADIAGKGKQDKNVEEGEITLEELLR